MTAPKGPLLFEIDDTEDILSPAEAPVIDPLTDPLSSTMTQVVHHVGGARQSWLIHLFWTTLLGLIGLFVSVQIWDALTTLMTRNIYVGGAALGLITVLLILLAVWGLREFAMMSRLRRVNNIQAQARQIHDLKEARALTKRLLKLYNRRTDMRWARDRFGEAEENVFDAEAQLALAETHLLAELDADAKRIVETTVRKVAALTAVLPLPLIDVIAALTLNLRMIRRIAEIYGGRGGLIGSWRLTKRVMSHLLVTGAVAVGDDMIVAVAGGGALAKISGRFGEGVINGTLTARVGVAAIEVCRPLPFQATPKPRVKALLKNSLRGLFAKS